MARSTRKRRTATPRAPLEREVRGWLDEAARTVRALEPGITVPVGYGAAGVEDPDLKAFLAAVGITPEAPVQRFSIQSRGASETQRVILLDCRG